MKNKRILIQVLFFGCLLMTLLLFVIIFSLIKIIRPDKNIENKKEIISKSYSLSDIKNISFDFKKSSANFKVSNNEELIIVQELEEEKFYINYAKKGKQLYFEEDLYIINPQKNKYTIYIPKNYLNKITIINGFGEIHIVGINNDIDINNNSGDLVLKETGNVRIKDVSGAVSFRNIVGNIEASSSTGNITIEDVKGTLAIETITGNIKVTKFVAKGESVFENVSGDIILKIDDKSDCKINYSNETGKTKIKEGICNNGLNIIDVKNITGIINIY